MAGMAHDEIRLLIAPFALGALPADEEQAVRQHLLSCDECLAEADSYNETAGSLALAAEPVPLPEGFADRVLRRVEIDRPAARGARESRRRSWLRPAAILSFAGLAAAILVLALGLADLRRDLQLERQVTQALLSDDGLKLAGAGARAAMVPTDDGSAFVVEGLGAAPEGRIYQLWLIDASGPASAGTFDVDGGRALLESGRSLEGVDAVAVTIEPAGGSRKPTTTPIISSS
jgi:anti-sigma-K factor RskA